MQLITPLHSIDKTMLPTYETHNNPLLPFVNLFIKQDQIPYT